jgi:quercetin dioxygenase-like cupin family protein
MMKEVVIATKVHGKMHDGPNGAGLSRKAILSEIDKNQIAKRKYAQYFTGSVRVDPLFAATDQTRVTVGHVTFEPGARTAWHTHPAGQILIVTSGTGWVQEWGSEKQEIKPGDVVWIPSGVKHWHGATATNGMSHIAIQEIVDGRNVDWMEKVTEEQYNMTSSTKTNAESDAPAAASAQAKQPNIEDRRLSPDDVRKVAPALERYTQDRLYGEVWKGPGLTRSEPGYCERLSCERPRCF